MISLVLHLRGSVGLSPGYPFHVDVWEWSFVIFAQIRIHILLSQQQHEQSKWKSPVLANGPNTVICSISNIYAFVMFLPEEFIYVFLVYIYVHRDSIITSCYPRPQQDRKTQMDLFAHPFIAIVSVLLLLRVLSRVMVICMGTIRYLGGTYESFFLHTSKCMPLPLKDRYIDSRYSIHILRSPPPSSRMWTIRNPLTRSSVVQYPIKNKNWLRWSNRVRSLGIEYSHSHINQIDGLSWGGLSGTDNLIIEAVRIGWEEPPVQSLFKLKWVIVKFRPWKLSRRICRMVSKWKINKNNRQSA